MVNRPKVHLDVRLRRSSNCVVAVMVRLKAMQSFGVITLCLLFSGSEVLVHTGHDEVGVNQVQKYSGSLLVKKEFATQFDNLAAY